jgi:hypothetical protein
VLRRDPGSARAGIAHKRSGWGERIRTSKIRLTLWHGIPGPRAFGPPLFAVGEIGDQSAGRMSVDAERVSAQLRELETFGRRVAETQGVSAHAPADWVAYGQAVQDALRKGHGIPLVGPYIAHERSSDLGSARLRPGSTPPRPVPIRTSPLLSNPPDVRGRGVVRPSASANLPRVWLSRLSSPPPADKRFLSMAWRVRVGAGTSWRVEGRSRSRDLPFAIFAGEHLRRARARVQLLRLCPSCCADERSTLRHPGSPALAAVLSAAKCHGVTRA